MRSLTPPPSADGSEDCEIQQALLQQTGPVPDALRLVCQVSGQSLGLAQSADAGFYFTLTQLCVYRSVFRDNHGALDRESRFSPLFKQESNKISVDDLVKLVSEYRR